MLFIKIRLWATDDLHYCQDLPRAFLSKMTSSRDRRAKTSAAAPNTPATTKTGPKPSKSIITPAKIGARAGSESKLLAVPIYRLRSSAGETT